MSATVFVSVGLTFPLGSNELAVVPSPVLLVGVVPEPELSSPVSGAVILTLQLPSERQKPAKLGGRTMQLNRSS